MQVTETEANGLKRAYSAVATAAEIDAMVTEKLTEVQKDVQLKGFRKGKAPISLLRKNFGKNVLGDVMNELVEATMRKHFEDSGHRPAKQPDVKITNESFDEGDDLSMEFSYEMLPDVPEMAFGDIALERKVVQVEDSQIDEALSRLAENAKVYNAKEGAAELEDQVVIDFVGRVDGEAFEGGAAEDFPLTLGSGQFIPGFEEQLVGLSASDEKDVEVAFPGDYGAEALAGKDAVFAVTVKEVRAAAPAPIDDTLAQRFNAETLDALRGRISEELSGEFRDAARALMKRQLLDKLSDMATFDLPPSLVEDEAKSIAHQLWHEEKEREAQKKAAEAAEKGEELAPEDQHDPNDHSHGEIEPNDEHRTLAERRVRLGLLLAHVGDRNDIQVSETELNAAIMRRAQQYRGQERQFFDFVRQNAGAMQQFRAPIFEDKVVDYIFELAKVSETDTDADALKAAIEALDAEDQA